MTGLLKGRMVRWDVTIHSLGQPTRPGYFWRRFGACAGSLQASVTRFSTLLLLAPFLGSGAQPIPHYSTGLAPRPDRSMVLTLDGSVSGLFSLPATVSNAFMQMFDLYPVEASTNLTDWARLALLLRTNNNPNPLRFPDTNAANFNLRFYRTPTNFLVTGFPLPTGPFPVGTLSRILTDSSRSNRYGIKTNSSFMSTFWYPAAPARAGRLPGPYTDRAVAGDWNWYSYWGWASQWATIMPACVAHSVPGAPVAAGTNRFPVIVHSHGYRCDRRLNAQDAEELASHGYVVVAVDHEDSHATAFPDERGVIYTSYSGDEAALLQSRTNDLVYVLQALAQIDTSDPLLAGRLDLGQIGMMGFSMGGGAAAETARLDSRVKCAALLDAYINFTHYPGLNSQGLRKPLLAMNRTKLVGDHWFWDFSPYSLRLYTLATANAALCKIANTAHFAFSDCGWSVEMTDSSRPAARVINAVLLWFFDNYLKGQALPFPANPEIINLQRK